MRALARISLIIFTMGMLLFVLGIGNGKGPEAGFMMMAVFGILSVLYVVVSLILAIVVLLRRAD